MTDAAEQCGLCRNVAELQESHLLPRAVFRLARQEQDENPNPIVVTPRGALATSRQISNRLLCGQCEDRFSRCGERFVLSQCLRNSGFEIRDKLQSLSPACESGEVAVYDVTGDQEIRADQYLYFAASVFWRASARQWHHHGRPVNRISLGTTYEDQFREYLLDEADFPDNGRVFVHVWRSTGPGATSVLPCSERINGTLRHKFCIPGLLFVLFLGQNTRTDHDRLALNSSTGRYLWLCPFERDSLFQGFGRLINEAEAASRRRRRNTSV